MKPSYGRVPTYPPSALNVLAHQGPITRCIADAALMLSVIGAPDVRDMTAWNSPPEDFSVTANGNVRGLRVALSMRLGQPVKLDPEIEVAVRKVARLLESEGAFVEEATPPLNGSDEMIRAMWWPTMTALADATGVRRGEMDPGLLEIAERGRRFTSQDYIIAYNRRAELHAAMMAFHERYDLLLTPTMPLTALEVGFVAPADGSYGHDWTNWSPYTYPFNLTQQPAASVPCGLASNGLPIGVQLVAAPRADALVLQVARTIEQALPRLQLPQPV